VVARIFPPALQQSGPQPGGSLVTDLLQDVAETGRNLQSPAGHQRVEFPEKPAGFLGKKCPSKRKMVIQAPTSFHPCFPGNSNGGGALVTSWRLA
jgi:hypothetical protein